MDKKIIILTSVIVLGIVIFYFMTPESHRANAVYTDAGNLEANAFNKTPKNEISKEIPVAQETMNLNEKQDDPLKRILKVTQKELAARYDIQVTTKEIRQYLKKHVDNNITDDAFETIRRSGKAQIAAAEEVYRGTMIPEEASEHYLAEWGGAEFWAESIKGQATKERIDEMKRMMPKDRKDAIEKSIKGHRDIVEGYEIAKQLLPEDKHPDNIDFWYSDYKRALFEYAAENLINRHPDLMMNIDEDEYRQRFINTDKMRDGTFIPKDSSNKTYVSKRSSSNNTNQ